MADRPFSRRLARLAVRALRGPARAHAADAWPGLRLDLDQGTIVWRGEEAGRLICFTDFAAGVGAEAVIFGSGPTLKDQAIERVPASSAVLLNGAMTLAGRLGGALAVAMIDERFVWRHRAMIAEHLPQGATAILSVGVLRALLSLDPEWARGRPVLLADGLLKPYGKPRRTVVDPEVAGRIVTGPGGAALSVDPGTGIMPAGTVALTALQMLLGTPVRRIGLAGIDLSSEPRFYEGAAVARSGMGLAEGRALPMLALAEKLARERGVLLEGYSPVLAGKLPTLPFSDRLRR